MSERRESDEDPIKTNLAVFVLYVLKVVKWLKFPLYSMYSTD